MLAPMSARQRATAAMMPTRSGHTATRRIRAMSGGVLQRVSVSEAMRALAARTGPAPRHRIRATGARAQASSVGSGPPPAVAGPASGPATRTPRANSANAAMPSPNSPRRTGAPVAGGGAGCDHWRVSSPARVLIVAHRTAATPKLLEHVRARAAAGPCAFVLVVPRPYWDPETEEAAIVIELAAPLIEEAAGAQIDAIVGDADPFVAVRTELERTP